ncbi:hypothetical protein A2331_00625 [Candidatus Falkowbacteria bacterium RIFOXYB2_FULL_34_18]|uniref:Methyltransferase FkbM domain-containing protein n=1 Tax=Candidatus Falkowbacteria bacterium RIFOXYD2_FULL_34_120 TaxID=1798007 RepID=A0A1F5TLX5_9BACT|nr:MAG: hypothetical protein A2331_00625 [Candidatus Falkowbacteria bacterium RIFOXYB2_FULL_34_18]OGF29196.1 MAG: hypothetical protein A2500_05940 [Candidatus Falkowbacteria bacterium RIFOXYC12_FULL_34_55]OGF37734.1 MAG: hypothetical protein A2466_06270 [Candidatus Falkowbacteria bacterium RIFOXYC2_FULL_34_220]OGF38718.1 MAG: hypothetical protein A2515_01605 [Candidatus Falkowbacteria bacterium RIFOXYD12_FULL_34_57]OGF39952.1 MAG: hypothetical protein A2531_01860 [Candidatus Falkowbacteria bact
MKFKKINFNGYHLNLNLKDDAGLSVVNEIFKYREYRIIENIIVDTDGPIVDAGAHLGFFTIYTKCLNQNSKIFCLEPEKDNIKILKENLANNNIADVNILQMALADKSGMGNLIISHDSHNHRLSVGGAVLKTQNLDIQKINTITISDLINKYQWPHISLLKMDIEGAEKDVINSLSVHDFSKIKAIVFEYHENYNVNHGVLEKILRKNGFGVEIFPSQFDKKMGILFANNKKNK